MCVAKSLGLLDTSVLIISYYCSFNHVLMFYAYHIGSNGLDSVKGTGNWLHNLSGQTTDEEICRDIGERYCQTTLRTTQESKHSSSILV